MAFFKQKAKINLFKNCSARDLKGSQNLLRKAFVLDPQFKCLRIPQATENQDLPIAMSGKRCFYVRGKLEVSCISWISKLKAYKLRNVTPKFAVKRKVWFRSLWVVCFLIQALKCNLIYTELFEASTFIFEAEKLNLLWIGVELAWKKRWRLYIFPTILWELNTAANKQILYIELSNSFLIGRKRPVNVQFQKISILPPTEGIGISWGWGVLEDQKI